MKSSPGRVKGLGEVSIRVRNLDTMHKFYEEVIGLELLRRDERFAFFKIAAGHRGHTQILALFDAEDLAFLRKKAPQVNPETTTLHHIALNVDLEDFELEKKRLQDLGLNVEEHYHDWVHFRSLYFPDPEGNLLEFVCYYAAE